MNAIPLHDYLGHWIWSSSFYYSREIFCSRRMWCTATTTCVLIDTLQNGLWNSVVYTFGFCSYHPHPHPHTPPHPTPPPPHPTPHLPHPPLVSITSTPLSVSAAFCFQMIWRLDDANWHKAPCRPAIFYDSFMMTSSNENNSALLALCVGNSPVTGEFSAQRPVTQSFDVFSELRLDKRLSKQ